MAQDSTTAFCLTETEVRVFNDIYDGREECYAHFVRAVRLMREWKSLHDRLKGQNRQLERMNGQYRSDELTYEQLLQLNAEDMSRLQKALGRADRKLRRRSGWMYILSGGLLAETIGLVTIMSLK